VALRTADRQGTGRGAGWDDPDGGWIEIQFPPPRPTIVPTDRDLPRLPPNPPMASPTVDVGRPPLVARIPDVLAQWRAAERLLAAEPEGTPAWTRSQARLIELRALHRALFEERLRSLEGDTKRSGCSDPRGWTGREWR
jgi:hypothetical protein